MQMYENDHRSIAKIHINMPKIKTVAALNLSDRSHQSFFPSRDASFVRSWN